MHIKISDLLTIIYSLSLWRLNDALNTNILDISDFTFYYTSYHYMLKPLSFETSTFYIDEIETNITIDFSESTTLILHDNENNQIELDFLNDNKWDEISTIQPIKDRASTKYIPLSEQEYIQELESRTSRSLLAIKNPYAQGYGQQAYGQQAYGQQAYGQQASAGGKEMNKLFTGINKATDFDSAENDCMVKHGHLAAISTNEQNDQVKAECNNMGKDWICWIGLKKPFGFWIDNSQVVFTNWIPGSPNDEGGQKDCVEMYKDGKWSDQECNHQRAYVCQKIEKGYPSVARSLITQKQTGHYGAGACGQKGKAQIGVGCGGCGGSPCQKARRRRRKRRKFRRRRGKRRRSEKRRRRRWRKRMRRIRKRKDKKLKKALRRLKRRHAREARTYAWIADLLHRKILEMKKTGQIAKFGEDRRRRRRMMEGEEKEKEGKIIFIDVISKCKVIRDFQVCLNHNLGEEFLSVDVKFVDKKVLKERKDKVINYRDSIKNTQKHFHGGYVMMENDDKWAFNPIEGYLGHIINKYEMMDWHSFNYIDSKKKNRINKKYEYGEFDELNDYIHYFDEFEFDFNSFKDDKNVNNTEEITECSQEIDNLPFKMCMKTTINIKNNDDIETLLFFEKDVNDKYDVKGMYEFQIKEYIDDGFEKTIFNFNNNDDWDEIDVIHLNKNNMKWIKKCSYKLIIAKICIEQFDEYNHRASIKLKSKNTKRDKQT